jgi:hypothetical protein
MSQSFASHGFLFVSSFVNRDVSFYLSARSRTEEIGGVLKE